MAIGDLIPEGHYLIHIYSLCDCNGGLSTDSYIKVWKLKTTRSIQEFCSETSNGDLLPLPFPPIGMFVNLLIGGLVSPSLTRSHVLFCGATFKRLVLANSAKT